MPDANQWAREVRARLSALRLSPEREAEIVDELSQHLDDYYRELIAAGVTPQDATQKTLLQFRSGNILAKYMAPLRQSRAPAQMPPAAPGGSMLADLWQDVRYAARIFSTQPAFAGMVVLTLALGIGATTAIFSVVYGVLLKPLPFEEPDRLVALRQRAPHGAGTNHGPATYLTYRENQQAFEAIGAWEPAQVSVTGAGEPERLQALLVSASTLPLLRVQPIIGRGFGTEDDTPGSPLRVILTYGYWQRRFGAAENIVGQRLVIDGRPAEVIGVLPASFKFLRTRPDVVLPLPLDVNAPRGISFDFQAIARLKPGVTLAQADADVARLISLLPPVFARLELQPNVRPLADEIIGDIGDTLWIFLAAVGVVLLIACGNVANLFLVRSEVRHRELAMRAALGASSARIARALLSESVVLAMAGGALGIAFAQTAIGLLRAIAPAELPRIDDIAIDGNVLLFTIAISVLSGALFGVFAVVRYARPNIPTLKEGGRAASGSHGRHRTRNALVVGQVALALTLLIVSGLMIRTFIAMREVHPGFTRPEEVQTFRITIPPVPSTDPSEITDDQNRAAQTFQAIGDQLAQVAGVISVGLASHITMDGEDNGNPIEVESFPVAEGQMPPLRRFKSLAPGFFETMGNAMVAGRSITWSDIFERRPVVVVSEPFAREYWGEAARAVGKRLRAMQGPGTPWREIVGVVGEERDDGLNHPPTPIVYWPMLSGAYRWRTMAYAVRSSRTGTPAFLGELQQAVWFVNPNVPLETVETLGEIQARSMAQTSFAMTMLAIAAGVALLLAIVGIYGALAYIAAQRTREIGIRMALGAELGDVRTMFLRHGLLLTATGIALGVGLALVATRVIAALLFGVGRTDPVTYIAVSLVLASVSLFATYLPARRAARVDPVVALRMEA